MSILRSISTWKALGLDLLLVGFLKACSLLLIAALTSIIVVSLWLEYFSSQLQALRIVVIPKPGKTVL